MIILFTTLGKSPNGIIPFNIVSFSIISKLEVINTHGKSISRLSGPFHFVNINKWLLCLLFLSNVCVQESATVWTTASQSSTSTSPTKTSPLISFVSSRATPVQTWRCLRCEAWTTPWTSTSSAPNVQTLSVSKWCFPECSKRTSSSGCTSPSCPGTLTLSKLIKLPFIPTALRFHIKTSSADTLLSFMKFNISVTELRISCPNEVKSKFTDGKQIEENWRLFR